MKPFDADKVFQDLLQHAQDAVGDVATAYLDHDMADDKWTAKIKKAKRQKVQDLHGWLSDELYNDADTIEGIIGDRMYDLCSNDTEKVAEVCRHIQGKNVRKAGAWYEACSAILSRL